MKPKQVCEQHRLLQSHEHNFGHKVLRKKKQDEEDKLAHKEMLEWAREVDHDGQGV
jgi:hypothetical protein